MQPDHELDQAEGRELEEEMEETLAGTVTEQKDTHAQTRDMKLHIVLSIITGKNEQWRNKPTTP